MSLYDREMVDRNGRVIEDIDEPQPPRLSRKNPRGKGGAFLVALIIGAFGAYVLWHITAAMGR